MPKRASSVTGLGMAIALGLCACQRPHPSPRGPGEPPRGQQASALTSDQLEEVQATVSTGLPTLSRHCYQPELQRRGKRFTANALVKILIGVSGAAQSVEFGETNIQSPAFRACIVEVIRTWTFPSLPAPTWFSYPVTFSPEY